MLAESLQHCTNVTELDLSDNLELGEAGAAHVAALLLHNRVITTIKLQFCRILDAGAVALATALRGNRVIRSLDLMGNQIGDTGAEALFSLLPHDVNLKSLKLSCNPISDYGAAVLVAILKNNEAVATTIDCSGWSFLDRSRLDVMDAQKV